VTQTRGQVVRFAAVGVFCTLLYLVVYAVLRIFLIAQVSNVLALLVSALANTAINGRFTFGRTERPGMREHRLGLLVFALGAVLTSAALAALHAASHDPGRVLEIGVLLIATAAATALRFVLFRHWVFRDVGHSDERHRPT